MYSFMLARLREEVKGLDVGIAALSGDLKGSLSRQDAAALALHQAQAQRTRAVALVHALSRHLEVGRAQRRLKRERMEASIAGQEAKLREMDERDKKRLTMSLMPRVRACVCVRGRCCCGALDQRMPAPAQRSMGHYLCLVTLFRAPARHASSSFPTLTPPLSSSSPRRATWTRTARTA